MTIRAPRFLIQLWDDLRPVALLRAHPDQRPHAGPLVDFNGEDAYDENCEWRRSRVQVDCPTCGVGVRPLVALQTTRFIASGWEWVGISYQQPWTEYACRCRRGHPFRLHLYTPQ